jgi:hypothetical protein
MAKRSEMRASDADRDRITDRLRTAAGEGRLLAHELEERLARALRARTYGELDAVVADLPGDHRPARRSRAPLAQYARPALVLAVAIPAAIMVVAVVLAAALFVMTGLFSMWVLWLVLGSIILGRRPPLVPGRRYAQRHRHGGPRSAAGSRAFSGARAYVGARAYRGGRRAWR